MTQLDEPSRSSGFTMKHSGLFPKAEMTPKSCNHGNVYTLCQKLGGNSNREVSKMFSSVTASIANKSMVPQGQYFEGADTH